jgi:hypothetical protein
MILALLAGFATTTLAVQVTLAVPQVWQHKDTNMLCTVDGNVNIHPWNHALNCPHCKMYCAPAAASMYGAFEGRVAPFTNQDNIYDFAKVSQGEIAGNGTIETHGVGMFAGAGGWPPEVQGAFTYAVGIQPFQHGPVAGGFPFITGPVIKAYIDNNQPILWVDWMNWPADMDSIPSSLESGHCKIIAGYNDNGTPGDIADDLYLIYDPWPTSGSPYWLPPAVVIDPADIYLTVTGPIAAGVSTWGGIKDMFAK